MDCDNTGRCCTRADALNNAARLKTNNRANNLKELFRAVFDL